MSVITQQWGVGRVFRIWGVIGFLLVFGYEIVEASPGATAPPLASLQSYTGIWEMPTARVLPDWHLRFQYGSAPPYHYYGGALGILGRLEVHGQFTRIDTLPGFVNAPEYGDYKDRAAGARLVLKRESDFWPQIAVGAFDATGTAFFGSRYLAVSKMVGPVDFTLGLGQGILAGEYVPETVPAERRAGELEQGFAFLTSNPMRPTRPFAGLEYHVNPKLTFSAEYSPLNYANMLGYRNKDGSRLKEDPTVIPINFGFKYAWRPWLHGRLAVMGGAAVAGGLSLELPLNPQGILAWKKVAVPEVGERLRWQAHAAVNDDLAQLVGERIKAAGFHGVAVNVGDNAVWIEAVNSVHLSDSRALGRMAIVADDLLPQRIVTLYLNLKRNATVIQSLRTSRVNLRLFMESRLDKDSFLEFAELELHGRNNWREFNKALAVGDGAVIPDRRFFYVVEPKIQTLLNDISGFFKHKGTLDFKGWARLWPGAELGATYQFTLFNGFDNVRFAKLEANATRTDAMLYAENSRPRITELYINQNINLPKSVQGRVGAGIFESAYAGVSGEIFRYFHDGLWGMGLESSLVRKRAIDKDFALSPDNENWYRTGFVNLYAQIWPEQGVEAGLKVGRFLAGDMGMRFELRRSFDYFTIGGWYTMTDTSGFVSGLNRGNREKGVYISFPLSLFKDRDIPGHLRYVMTSFTRDPGQNVIQPGPLYPMNPWSTPNHARRTLEDMRINR